MIYIFVAPTATGVLQTLNGFLPMIESTEDASIEQLVELLQERYQVDFQLLFPVGRGPKAVYYSVGAVYEQGRLTSLPPRDNYVGLLTALVRGALNNWSLSGSNDDFSIKFLGS